MEACTVCIGTVPLNITNLRSAYWCLNVKVWLPTRVGATRLTGHVLPALDNFITGYCTLRLHLEQVNTNTSVVIQFIFISVFFLTKELFPFQLAASKKKSDSKSKALGFLNLMQSCDIIAMSIFLHYMLMVLHQFSLKFQQDGAVLTDVSLAIKMALSRI